MAIDTGGLAAPTIPNDTLTPGLGLPSLDDILNSITRGQNPGAAGSVPGAAGGAAMDPKIQALLGLLGIGGQFGAAAIQQGNTNSAANYLKQIGGAASGQNAGNLGNASNVYSQQQAGLGSILDGSNPYSQMLSQGYIPNQATLNNLLPSLVNPGKNAAEFAGLPTNQIYGDPNMTAQVRGITDLTSATGGMLNKASQLLNSGGITDTQSPLNNFAMQLMQGQSPNQLALSGAGTSLLGSSGMTPALQNALDQASGVVSNQGQTALTNKLAQTGLGLAGASPLLSGAQAASIAEDQAGRGYANAAKNAREQANLRGQGAGSVVANGAGNNALADTADQALNGIATAGNNARLGQQGLGLQQQQQGLNTALGASGLQQGLELGGLGAVGNLTGAQGGLLNTGGNLTNSASQLASQGGNFYNALLGLQQGNMAQGFQAGQSGVSQQSGLLQQALSDIMNGQNNSAATGNSLANLYQGNQGALLNGINSGASNQLGALGQLGSQGGNWLQAAMQALGTYGGTGNSFSQLMQQPNSYAVTLNNLGGSLQNSGSGTSKTGNALATGLGTTLGTILNGQLNGSKSGGGISNLFGGDGGGFDLSSFFNQPFGLPGQGGGLDGGNTFDQQNYFNQQYERSNGNMPGWGGGYYSYSNPDYAASF